MDIKVVVRGGGDISSGVINRLYKMGVKVLVLEIEKPNFIRRKVCYGQAIYEKEYELEGAVSKFAESIEDIEKIWNENKIPVYIDPEMKVVDIVKPDAVVDAIIAKKNLGFKISKDYITIALGPGFEAGKDADVVIETNRGHNLGRVIFEGKAAENTGVPGVINGFGRERVVYAPEKGILTIIKDIGSIVKKDEIIAYVDDVPVYATLSGLVRGMIRDKSLVTKGLKIGDIDPRESEYENCFTISDKARTVSGGVAEALFYLLCKKGKI